ncbi:MAG: DNA repair protein RecO [Deltaproteobacteria bacterium]|nr:DNA repair protein RecO [Deltaproteobacteria bacterium]
MKSISNMKNCISPAIIMRIKEFGESDLLVYFFTLDMGRLKGVAKGARRSRRRFVNCLDNFCLVDLEYDLKGKGDLHFIHSGKLIDAYPGLRTDFATLSKASFMIELTEILFPWELPDRKMFELLKESFRLLANGGGGDLIPVIFEVKAMALGGYGINLEKCCTCGRTYTGEGTAVFKPGKGGIACLNCQEITAVSTGMSPGTVEIMRLIQSKAPDVFNKPAISDEIISEIKPVMKLHREYHLGQRTKTSSYLE